LTLSAELRIGFVTTSFPRYSGDAAGSFVFGLARGLAGRGHRIQVVVPEPSGPSDWQGGADWLDGVEVLAAAYARPRGLQRLFWGDGAPDNMRANPALACLGPFAAVALLAKTSMLARSWDLAVSHWLVPSALAAGVVKVFGVRHIAVAHSADVNLLGRLPFGPWLGAAITRSADHFGFVSCGLRDEFLSLLPNGSAGIARERSSVLPMGIDSEELVSGKSRGKIRRELGINGFCVLFLGRLVPIKGVDLLIDAMRDLQGSTLVVAGDGSMRASLEKRAIDRGVNARFLGFVGPKERAGLLLACDAAALPSRVLSSGRHEGLPVALMEIMQSGRPVVVSATGSMPELVEDGVSGLVVPPNDASALRDALKRLYKNPELAHRLAWDGKRRVKDRDWSAVLNSWEDLIFRIAR
jgi:glycosyltransferase involved in cell wall biosynthesis